MLERAHGGTAIHKVACKGDRGRAGEGSDPLHDSDAEGFSVGDRDAEELPLRSPVLSSVTDGGPSKTECELLGGRSYLREGVILARTAAPSCPARPLDG